MAISEMVRQALQQKLDEVLGPKEAWALMEEVFGRDLGKRATKGRSRPSGRSHQAGQ